MKLAQVKWTRDPGDLVRFRAAVRSRMPGEVRMKASGCRTGHFLIREEAVGAFERLAAEYGVEVFVYAPGELERPRRRSGG